MGAPFLARFVREKWGFWFFRVHSDRSRSKAEESPIRARNARPAWIA